MKVPVPASDVWNEVPLLHFNSGASLRQLRLHDLITSRQLPRHEYGECESADCVCTGQRGRKIGVGVDAVWTGKQNLSNSQAVTCEMVLVAYSPWIFPTCN